tara:strand:+ start:341 stop:565 length:225 start_codon:yes stop_codon:yes gene_type:complete
MLVRKITARVRPRIDSRKSNKKIYSRINDDIDIIINGMIKLNGKYRYFESIIANGIKKLIIIIEKMMSYIISKL